MDMPTDKDVQEVARLLQENVELADRKFVKCFVGEEAVNWMCKVNMVGDRKEAVRMGQILIVAAGGVVPDRDKGDRQEGSQQMDPDIQSTVQVAQAAYPTLAEGESLGSASNLTRGYPASGVGAAPDPELLDRLGLAPVDHFNQKLADLTHPPHWPAPQVASTPYNMVVIGGGTAGLVTAAGSAGVGAKVAMVENRLMGGDCLNEGCVPSKALLRFAKDARMANRVFCMNESSPVELVDDEGRPVSGLGDMGWRVRVNFDTVMREVRRLRSVIAEHDSAKRIASKYGVDIFFGTGRFISKNQVQVTDEHGKQTVLQFVKCCIATGASAAIPPIAGLQEVDFLTNATVFNMTELPKRLAIIGAGAIGCELGQAFQMLGAEVHLFARSDRVLPFEEPLASETLGKQLTQDGVQLHLSIKYEEVMARNEGSTTVKVIRFSAPRSDAPEQVHEVVVDSILVATGRKPNFESLNLEAAGVDAHPKDGIAVNDRLQTRNPNIYAAGDVCGQFKFTHVADFMARIVIRNALFFGHSKVSALSVPWTTFTYPEVAHLGSYKRELEAQGVKYHAFIKHFSDNDRAIVDGEEAGFVEIMTDPAGQLLGATVVSGSKAGEMIGELSVIKGSQTPFDQVAQCIHPYPTHGEAIRLLGDDFNRTRMTPFVSGVFDKLMKLQR